MISSIEFDLRLTRSASGKQSLRFISPDASDFWLCDMGQVLFGPQRWSTKPSLARNGSLIVGHVGRPALTLAVSGVISYSKGKGPIFATHPMEKPFRKLYPTFWTDRSVIFQIGSSDPELALQAAKTVEQDVAGL